MRAFNQITIYDFENGRKIDMAKEIQSSGKDYILKVDEQEYINYLYDKYVLTPITIHTETEYFGTPYISKETVTNYAYDRGYHEVDTYLFTVVYDYSGSDELFYVHTNPWTYASYDITLDNRLKKVSFDFKIYNQDAEEFRSMKTQCFSSAFANVVNANKNAEDFNRLLRDSITRAFQKEKEKCLKENDFFAAINIKVNQDTKSVFTAPTITKKIIPQPVVSNNKEFSSEPMMSSEMYIDVLKVIYESGKNMEKKPALYIGKDEEGLRDQFLFVLETRYEGTTATGETFNRSGKTDIILKYANDGSNLFVAECKFWHGASELLSAISQLFERYLTWRDSKAALIMFVKNKDFSNVISSIKNEAKKHSLFVKESGQRGETSFSYIFCLPQDNQKHVLFEIVAFHYDK
ncbi:MAG: hypothetical protein V4556_00745 [Bacteroidota bacterium]